MGADGPRRTRPSIRAATVGFSLEASRRSATAPRTPAAAVPTRTTSSRGKQRRRRSHARPRPPGPACSHRAAQAARLRRGLLGADPGAVAFDERPQPVAFLAGAGDVRELGGESVRPSALDQQLRGGEGFRPASAPLDGGDQPAGGEGHGDVEPLAGLVGDQAVSSGGALLGAWAGQRQERGVVRHPGSDVERELGSLAEHVRSPVFRTARPSHATWCPGDSRPESEDRRPGGGCAPPGLPGRSERAWPGRSRPSKGPGRHGSWCSELLPSRTPAPGFPSGSRCPLSRWPGRRSCRAKDVGETGLGLLGRLA